MKSEFTPKVILVTGGAGFIGSNFINYLFSKVNFDGCIVNIDKLTYAGNHMSLDNVCHDHEGVRYFFEQIDIYNRQDIDNIFKKYNPDCVVHFAAESHVDRSIVDPTPFIESNLIGTFNLLETVRLYWKKRKDVLFHHVSTDEVFGSLSSTGYFTERTAYNPRSPYSATKAGSDHLVSAYFHTFGIPVTISNSSNNYGPRQYPEKFIPLLILNMLEGENLPIYGTGENVRDWLYVEDHCAGIWVTINRGIRGQSYIFGGKEERTNNYIVHEIINKVSEISGVDRESLQKKISYIKDRPGHDYRYAIDSTKAREELNWEPENSLAEGLERTVRWYLANPDWIKSVRTKEYMEWNYMNYKNR